MANSQKCILFKGESEGLLDQLELIVNQFPVDLQPVLEYLDEEPHELFTLISICKEDDLSFCIIPGKDGARIQTEIAHAVPDRRLYEFVWQGELDFLQHLVVIAYALRLRRRELKRRECSN